MSPGEVYLERLRLVHIACYTLLGEVQEHERNEKHDDLDAVLCRNAVALHLVQPSQVHANLTFVVGGLLGLKLIDTAMAEAMLSVLSPV